jgi:ribosomal protein S17E
MLKEKNTWLNAVDRSKKIVNEMSVYLQRFMNYKIEYLETIEAYEKGRLDLEYLNYEELKAQLKEFNENKQCVEDMEKEVMEDVQNIYAYVDVDLCNSMDFLTHLKNDVEVYYKCVNDLDDMLIEKEEL